MNKTTKLLSVTFSMLVSSLAFAQVLVEDTNIKLFDFPQMRIYQDVAASDSTDIYFTIESGRTADLVALTFDALTLDEGSSWYFAEFDDVFSTSSIEQGTHKIWGGIANDGSPVIGNVLEVPIGEFYLGVTTVATNVSEVFGSRFGWARFSVNSDLELQLVDNAVAYGSNQIIIGQNAIPEPSTMSVMILLTALFVGRRKSKDHQANYFAGRNC